MLIYNAFPLAYHGLEQVIDQLPTIHHMGFNIIWFNPIQDSRRWEAKGYRGGSLYSMTSDEIFLRQWQDGDVRHNEHMLTTLSTEAKSRNITLMFDLVMNQAGRRLAESSKYRHLFSNPSRGQFDYSTPARRAQVFNEFFKPFIEKYVVKYGFTGMRIDAAGLVPADMQMMAIQLFRSLCQEHHQTDGVVLGEYLESLDKIPHFERTGIRYDIITNGTHWAVNSSPYFDPKHRGSHNHDMGVKRSIAHSGSIGWTGNHDIKIDEVEGKGTLYHYCAANLPKHTMLSAHDKDFLLAKMMRERIAVMTFISDGGYYLLCGDEYGSPQLRCCFEWENDDKGEPALRPGQTYQDNWGGKYDLSEFISQVNLIRHQLPKKVGSHFWSEQYVVSKHLDPNHNIKCIVRNNEAGFSGSMDIIFVNVSPAHDKVLEMHAGIINNIKEQIKAAHPEFDWNKKDITIYLAGRFHAHALPHDCVMIAAQPDKLEDTRQLPAARPSKGF